MRNSMLILMCLALLSTVAPGAQGFSLRDATHHMHSNAGAEAASSADRPSSEVLRLPGLQQELPSKHYAGYIPVDEESQRQLFYYLVTHEGSASPRDDTPLGGVSAPPRDDTPLIIWLTGGPGCSSMDAFTYENGPFKFTAPAAEAAGRQPSLQDIQLHPNPHSWSKTAHVLYIDSPAGTGFSYTPGESTYHTDDDRTIRDLESFVAGFFQEHAWLREQPLYIAGESYGGVYVPLLTRALLHHNQRLQQQRQQLAATNTAHSSAGSSGDQGFDTPYNLAGYIVGNAVTDDVYDGSGQVEFAYGNGLIDPDTYQSVKRTCKANGWHVAPHSPCANALDTMESTMGPINQYNILGRCFHPSSTELHTSSSSSSSSSTSRRSGSSTAAVGSTARVDYKLLQSNRRLQQQQEEQEAKTLNQAVHGLQLASGVGGGRLRAAQQLRHAISCADRRYASVYYNRPEVRRALHAANMGESGRWEPCSDVLHYTHTIGSMIPVHRELLDAGLRGLVLSGDADYVVPFTGSRAWVHDMGMKPSKPWHTWTLQGDDQVTGYAVQFRAGLTFATVKGGGHMVPQTHPQAALSLLQQWMQDEL